LVASRPSAEAILSDLIVLLPAILKA